MLVCPRRYTRRRPPVFVEMGVLGRSRRSPRWRSKRGPRAPRMRRRFALPAAPPAGRLRHRRRGGAQSEAGVHGRRKPPAARRRSDARRVFGAREAWRRRRRVAVERSRADAHVLVRGPGGLRRGFLSALGPIGSQPLRNRLLFFGRHRTALPRRLGVGRGLRDCGDRSRGPPRGGAPLLVSVSIRDAGGVQRDRNGMGVVGGAGAEVLAVSAWCQLIASAARTKAS